MSRNSISYCIAIVSLVGTFCLAMTCAASAQYISSYAAQPPAAEQPEAEVQPRVSPPEPEEEPTEPLDMDSMYASRSPIIRLASVPNMFGDPFGGLGQIVATDVPVVVTSDIPPAGGSRRAKISENNKALPMDRVYFMYNHYHNALNSSVDVFGPLSSSSASVDRYTIGMEKTFCDGLWSAELRLPFGNAYRYSYSDAFIGGGEVGNLSVVLKRLLYVSQYTSVAAGLGIETPTGEDFAGVLDSSPFILHNDAVHLSPFIGFLRAPNSRLFYQGFLQIDVAANGNRVVLDGYPVESLSEQNLFYVDLSLGYWLFRNPHSRCINGLAAVVEYHYTTTVQDADIVSGTVGLYDVELGNTHNRLDVSNLTAGLHTELGKTTVRVAGVVPLTEGSNRSFDAEVQFSVNRRF